MRKLARLYSLTAVTLASALLFLLALNGLAALAIELRPVIDRYLGETSSFLARYGDGVFDLYPELSHEEVRQLLRETWTRPLVYEDFTQFKERPFTGRYVNVSEAGFRNGGDAPVWPPDPDAFNLFVYGGSTTFGYGVADSQTVPARLEHLWRAKGRERLAVYNFGRGFYDSTHEMLLFTRHLYRGEVPDAAIFIDGTNEFHMAGERGLLFSYTLAEAGRASSGASLLTLLEATLEQTALMQVRYWVEQRFGRKFEAAGGGRHTEVVSTDGGEAVAARTIERYRNNQGMIRALARAYDVPVLFVWQPIPSYDYDLSRHPFGLSDDQIDPAQTAGYAKLDRMRAAGALGPDFLWCGGIQRDVTGPLYIDAVHYAPPMSDRIARCIIDGAPWLLEGGAPGDDE